MSVTVIYSFQPAQDEGEALVDLLKKGRDITLGAAGCKAFDVYQGVNDPHDVVMIEEWSSREAHQQHFGEAVRGSDLFDRLMTLLIEPPAPVYYQRRS